MTPRIPTNYIVQIDNFHLGEFIYYWNYYEQPCSLLLQKPNTEGLTAIKLVVDSDEAASFLLSFLLYTSSIPNKEQEKIL